MRHIFDMHQKKKQKYARRNIILVIRCIYYEVMIEDDRLEDDEVRIVILFMVHLRDTHKGNCHRKKFKHCLMTHRERDFSPTEF